MIIITAWRPDLGCSLSYAFYVGLFIVFYIILYIKLLEGRFLKAYIYSLFSVVTLWSMIYIG